MTRTIYRERIPSHYRALGRHINHDSESRRYEYRPRRARGLASVRHVRRIGILDQGDLGSCTAEAGIGCLGTGPFYDTVTRQAKFPLSQTGALDLYREVTRADPYPGAWEPDDTGSDGLSIAKVLTGAGQIVGYQHTFSLDAALAALMDLPLITGVNWYEDMFRPTLEGIVDATGALAGGHEVVVDEYDAARGLVGFSNSWGEGWGVGGRFFMAAEDYGRLLDQQGDVTVFVPVTDPPPAPEPTADEVFAQELRPWVARRHTGCNARAARAAKTWLTAKGL